MVFEVMAAPDGRCMAAIEAYAGKVHLDPVPAQELGPAILPGSG